MTEVPSHDVFRAVTAEVLQHILGHWLSGEVRKQGYRREKGRGDRQSTLKTLSISSY